MNKLLLKGVAAAFCMATMFGTTACGDDDDLVNVEPPVEETQDVILEGEITSDMTLKAADNNLLRGFVYVTGWRDLDDRAGNGNQGGEIV